MMIFFHRQRAQLLKNEHKEKPAYPLLRTSILVPTSVYDNFYKECLVVALPMNAQWQNEVSQYYM